MRLQLPFIWWRKKEKHPLIRRNEQLFSKFDLSRPMDTYDFVALDTELTGLNSRRDEIVSVAAVRIRGLQIVVGDCFYSYARPSIEQHTTSTFIHRITPDELKDAPDLTSVLEAFVDFCGDSVLVGHFVHIDRKFLRKAMMKSLGGVMRNPLIDSMQLARFHRNNRKAARVYREVEECSYNLAELSRAYNLPIFPAHDALQDALQTAYLFIFLVKNLCDEEEMTTLKQFRRVGRPAWGWL